MKTLYTLLFLSLTTLGFGQEVTRKVEPFTSLIVSRGVDVRLVQSSSDEIIIRTKGIEPEDVLTENRGDALVIKVATKSLWQEMQDNYWWARIEVPYETLENMEINTGAKISANEIISGDVLDIQTNMGGEVEFEVQLTELIIESNMGAMAEVAGTARFVKATASMGAGIDLRDLNAEEARAKSSMGSDIKVHATKAFDGRANMGGTIRVTGDPVKFYESTSMGGDIYN